MKDSFIKNAALLIGGQALGQIITLLISPVLTRACSVEDFASYSLYSAALGLISQVACLKLDMAASLASGKSEAGGLTRLSLISASAFTIICAFCLPASPIICRVLRASDMRWFSLLPLSVLGNGMLSAFTALSIRAQSSVPIVKATFIRCSFMVLAQLAFAFAGAGFIALPLGQALSYFPALIPLWRNVKEVISTGDSSLKNLAATAKNNIAFPSYTTLGALINSSAYHITNFFISALFTPAMLGYYGLCTKILSAPLGLFSSPVGQIFMRNLSLARERGENARLFYWRVSCGLLLLAGVGFVVLMPLAGAIPILFGGNWSGAVPVFRILLPLYLLRFALNPVSGAAVVLGRQRETAIWQSFMAFLALVPAFFFWRNAYYYLACMTVTFSCGYILFFLYSSGLLKRDESAEVSHG